MPYVPGGDCSIGSTQQQCDGCFPSKATSPVVVKIIRPINRNANRRGCGGGMPSSRGDCCQWCKQKQNANQMVFNQNKIVNFDLINRINDASGMTPYLSYTSTRGGTTSKRNCDNCINILREKELQLLKKEQEILKIKTHFTNLPKRGGAYDGIGANCEQCFKALREKEFELFRKDQEIAKMKRSSALKSPIDTQAKVERARCANCFKALRQKELELIKKEHALMKNLTRPNINVKNLNYCSCCRDNKKSSINKMKKQEQLRRKNRDNCFKQVRMKEIRLLAKEKEIEKKIQKFREESLAKAKLDLQKLPDPRLIKPTTKEVIKCVCSCTGLPEFKERKEKATRGVCAFFYKKFPRAAGGFDGPSEVIVGDQGQYLAGPDAKMKAKALKKLRRCSHPCCVMKMASNMAACFLTPPKAKKVKELPEVCRFMKMVSWCTPDKPKHVVKCCIIPSEPGVVPTVKEQKRFEKRVQKQKSIAIKAAKAAAESSSEYKVDTIGQIRPGKSRPSSEENLNVWEEEVLRTYGPKGLRAYKAKMAELKIDTEVAHAKMPKRITSRGTYEAVSPIKYSPEASVSQMRLRDRGGQPGSKEQDLETEVSSMRSKSTRRTFKTKIYNRATKKLKKESGPGSVEVEKSETDIKLVEEERKKLKKYKAKPRKVKKKEGSVRIEEKEYKKKARKYEKMSDDEEEVNRKYNRLKRYEYERANIPKQYTRKTASYDEDYGVPRGYGSGDYVDEWGTSRKKGPAAWCSSGLPTCPKYLKMFGQLLVYCAGCFIGIPCILFLCLCFFATTCSD